MFFDFVGKRDFWIGNARANNKKEWGGLIAPFSLLNDLSDSCDSGIEINNRHTLTLEDKV